MRTVDLRLWNLCSSQRRSDNLKKFARFYLTRVARQAEISDVIQQVAVVAYLVTYGSPFLTVYLIHIVNSKWDTVKPLILLSGS